jgi:uncharacterized protein YbjQ (UPF0145 family)
MAQIPIFTTQVFNQSTLQPVGAIFVQRVESISVVRDLMAGFGGIVGGRSKTMEKKMNDLTVVVLQELQDQAKAKYPNAVAIVGVNIDFSQIGSGENDKFIAGQASGTVLVKRAGGSTAPAQPPVAPMALPPPAAAPVGGRRKRRGAKKSQTRRNKH